MKYNILYLFYIKKNYIIFFLKKKKKKLCYTCKILINFIGTLYYTSLSKNNSKKKKINK